MTAPLRSHGQLVALVKRGCSDKRRYCDEYAARAAGQEREAQSGFKMYVYHCKICRGVHLTRNRQNNPMMAVDWRFGTTKRKVA